MEQKKQLREIGIRNRKRLTEKENMEYSARIVEQILGLREFQKARTILIYKAIRGEVDLTLLEHLSHISDKRFVYPYCISQCEMIALQPYSEDAWSVGRYGIMEPIPERGREVLPEEIDLVICPCVAFDEECNRIGMGAGYYDRYLERCTKASVGSCI